MMKRKKIIKLLNTKVNSKRYYNLLKKANSYARKTFKKGYVFAQIGINNDPCSGNCKFCSLAKDNYIHSLHYKKSINDIINEINVVKAKVSDIFLMTTEDYNKNDYLSLVLKIREIVPKNINIVANIGDFDYDYACKLKESGVNACYHIKRLREGIDTSIEPKKREATINAIIKSKMKLYYCIEPISTKHSYKEIATEIEYARNLKIDVMAVMKKISISSCDGDKEIIELELAKITAVTLLAVRPKISMNAHEPNYTSLLSGVNQLYAEYGVNPRDLNKDTENSRGISIRQAEDMLNSAGWEI